MSAAKDLLSTLRGRTRPLHDRLESLTLGHRIMDGSLTPAEYRQLLDWQRRAHQQLEPAVAEFTGEGYRYRRRFPAVVASAETLATVGLPVALGILYVLEGASLGGSVILRQLRANPALNDEAPFDFYAAQAEWGLSQWRSFVAYAQKLDLSTPEIDRAAESAVNTFSVFERLWP